MTKIYLNDIRAIAHAIAQGLTVWCEETGEGWSYSGTACYPPTARQIARRIFTWDEEAKTFYVWDT